MVLLLHGLFPTREDGSWVFRLLYLVSTSQDLSRCRLRVTLVPLSQIVLFGYYKPLINNNVVLNRFRLVVLLKEGRSGTSGIVVLFQNQSQNRDRTILYVSRDRISSTSYLSTTYCFRLSSLGVK